MTDRNLDVVLWGATGFTGKLVAAELAAQPDLRWAIAGRDRGKLERVRDQLGVNIEILRGDASDRGSLDAIARSARVVCSTVGPYALLGSELVAACVANQTHYCDLTGEVDWVREMIDAHHERAAADGTRIVHCCGFDSIPSDLGVLMMHLAMRERGRWLGRVDAYFGESKGGISGGTVASMLEILDRARTDRRTREILLDPHGLDPVPGTGRDRVDLLPIDYDKRLGLWSSLWAMAAINAPVVRRSNAVAGDRYGEHFRYRERLSLPGKLRGLALAAGVSAGLGAFALASQIGPLRTMIEARLPTPGQGPSQRRRESGYFVVRILAEAHADPRLTLRGRVADDRDAGYASTAVMLSQSALCLAFDDLESPGGVLTPASAMGTQLLERLRAAGMTFELQPDQGSE